MEYRSASFISLSFRLKSRPLTRSIRCSFDLYGPKQAEVANIADPAAGATDAADGGSPFPGDARDLFEDAILRIDIEGGKRGGAASGWPE